MLCCNGTLPLRYCAARFAWKAPTWRLPVSGHVARLIADYSDSRPRVWKRLRQVGFSGISLPDHTRRRCDHAFGYCS